MRSVHKAVIVASVALGALVVGGSVPALSHDGYHEPVDGAEVDTRTEAERDAECQRPASAPNCTWVYNNEVPENIPFTEDELNQRCEEARVYPTCIPVWDGWDDELYVDGQYVGG